MIVVFSPSHPFFRLLVAVSAGALVIATGQVEARSNRALPNAGTQKNATYASVDECIIVKAFGETLCRNGFANARAEFEEKAPRFSTRQPCESAFAQCSVFVSSQPNSPASLAKRGILEFAPTLERVEFIKGKIDAGTVKPVTRANKVPFNFTPRTLEKADIEISAKRGEVARQSWQTVLARANQSPPKNYTGAADSAGAISFDDPQAGVATDQPASVPVSAKRWSQIQSQIERIKHSPPGPAPK